MFRSRDLCEITKIEFIELLAVLSSPTRFQTLMMLRTVYREAIDRELVLENPLIGIRPPRLNPQPSKFLTWKELNEIDFGRQNSRIRFLALHGLRFGEAAALSESDIRDGQVHITKSKYGPTKSPAGVRTVTYLGFFDPFPKYQRTIAEKLAPYGVTVHSLRKTYAYNLKIAKIHVTTASKLTGHANPLVTMKIYAAVKDDEIVESGQAIRIALELS